jgi:hypothetical protein
MAISNLAMEELNQALDDAKKHFSEITNLGLNNRENKMLSSFNHC